MFPKEIGVGLMPDDTKNAIFERLKHSVQLLASSAEVQLQYLPAGVCKADELALEFDQWREVALHNYDGDLTPGQRSSLNALNERLDWLTKNGPEHWTEAAVRTSPLWNDIRQLAVQVLNIFGWSAGTPPSHASEYKIFGTNRN
jgi:hypothetical protein